MKKSWISLSVLLSSVVLVACAQTSTTTSNNTSTKPAQTVVVDDDQMAQATFVITNNGKSTEKTVNFEVGDSIMDVLEDNFNAEEEDGMVIAIDGVSQDAANNTYWMYKVNDQVAEVGAENYELKADDKVEFYLEKF